MRWRVIERYEVVKKGSHSLSRMAYTGREDFFEDHFPGKPMVPQTLLIEMIAHAGGVPFGSSIGFGKEVIMAKIEEAVFPEVALPPCQLTIEGKIEEQHDEGAWVSGTVTCGQKVIARARILLVTMEVLSPDGKKVVFSDRFLRHYDIDAIAKKSEA